MAYKYLVVAAISYSICNERIIENLILGAELLCSTNTKLNKRKESQVPQSTVLRKLNRQPNKPKLPKK